MNAFVSKDLKRISKFEARRIWGKTDQTISLCPCKLRPDGPFRPNIDVFPETQKANDFEKFVREFEWFNCSLSETGSYASFYLRAKSLNPIADKLASLTHGVKDDKKA